MKLLATVSVALVALGTAACGGSKSNSGSGSTGGGKKTVKVGLAYDIGGRGDKSFNDAAAAGLEKAKSDLNIQTKELSASPGETDNDKYSRLKLLCTAGYNPIVAVGFSYAGGGDPATGPLAKAASECPNTKFAIVDDASVNKPNLTNLVFAAEQGSFLVGAAAALKSKTGHVGFVGGCLVDLIKTFQAGYEAGARQVKSDIKIDVKYLSTTADNCSGFNDPAKGQTAAEGMYDGGADIVYQAAGGSGTGVFKAAKAKGQLAIGVDSDQYNTVSPDLRDVIMTSMLKRVDTAVFTFIKDYAAGTFKAGVETFDLKNDGVGYSTSGGKIDDIKSKLDAYKQQIIAGKITVPTKPAAG